MTSALIVSEKNSAVTASFHAFIFARLMPASSSRTNSSSCCLSNHFFSLLSHEAPTSWVTQYSWFTLTSWISPFSSRIL